MKGKFPRKIMPQADFSGGDGTQDKVNQALAKGDINWKAHFGIFFPNHACQWGSYSSERNSVSADGERGSPVMNDRLPQRFRARS